MKQYLEAMQHILDNGVDKENRTGVDTRSVFGYQSRYDLGVGFPAVTTKKLAFKSVTSELLWFLEGSDDERRLAEIHYGKPREELVGKKTIWLENADAQGKALGYENTDLVKKLGPVYGVQWRRWTSNRKIYAGDPEFEELRHRYNGALSDEIGLYFIKDETVDQIDKIINQLKNNPNDRRIILTAFNVAEISKMALPPCHCFANFNVTDGKLNCMSYIRSNDYFLGASFNISSYALLMHMLAQVSDLDVGELVYTVGDLHLYHNHFEQAKEQLSREPYPLPTLWLNPDIKSIDDFTMNDIKLIDYKHHDTIKAPMAV